MSPIRILVVTNLYPPHHLGGYELACLDVVERWRARGHHVEVLTTLLRVPGVTEPADERINGVRRDLDFYWKDYRTLTPSLPARLRIERANQRALERALAEVRPDVVSAWHMGAMSLGLLQTITERKLPMVLVIADDWLVYGRQADMWTRLFQGRPRLGALVRKLTGVPTSVTLNPDDVTACFASDYMRRRALDQSTFPLGRTTVTYLGIDRGDFPDSVETDRPWSWKMLTVGRVEERKGVHVAIDALRHLPDDATLDVVGPAHDRYLDRLRRSAETAGVEGRVRFLGPAERSEVRDHMREADVFLFPVLWDEPFGLVPLEAMACGTPVVATGTGGSGEFLLDERNALITAPGDAMALARSVRRLASEEDVRRRLIAAGRQTIAQLGADELTDVLESWHVAAADRFRDGVPPDRPPIGSLVGGAPT